jgi:hypothetical protein
MSRTSVHGRCCVPCEAAHRGGPRATNGDGTGSQGGSKARIRMRPAPDPRSGSPACPDQVPLRLLRMTTKRRMTQRRVADAGDPCYGLGSILLDDQAFFRYPGRRFWHRRAGTTGWHCGTGVIGLALPSWRGVAFCQRQRITCPLPSYPQPAPAVATRTRVHDSGALLCHVISLAGRRGQPRRER